MDEILQELRALREEVGGLKEQLGVGPKVPRVPKPPRTPCIGVTGKGTACRNSAQPGHDYCRMHGDRPVRPEKPKKVKKEPKPKKIQPEHTHELGRDLSNLSIMWYSRRCIEPNPTWVTVREWREHRGEIEEVIGDRRIIKLLLYFQKQLRIFWNEKYLEKEVKVIWDIRCVHWKGVLSNLSRLIWKGKNFYKNFRNN